MSNLKVNNITALDGGAPNIPGFESGGGSGSGADAWASVSSAGILLDGLNIASTSRTALGTYDVVFTTPMPNDNYSVTTGGFTSLVRVISKTANGFEVETYATLSTIADLEFYFAVFATNALPPTKGGTGTDAWATVDLTTVNGPCNVPASFNVASVTRTGTGDYSVVLTTPMPTSDYSVTVGVESLNSLGSGSVRAKTTSGFQVFTGYITNSQVIADFAFNFTVNATNATLPATLTQDMVVMKSGDTMTGNLNVEAFISVLEPAANGDGSGISNGTSPYNGMYIDSPISPGRTGAIGMTISDQNVANISLSKKAPSTTGSTFIRFNYQGTVSGSITLQTSTSINYNATSDYRLKENVVPIAGAASLVSQLKPYRYNFISNPELPMLGFLAHEVQEVLPSVVTGTKDAVDEDGNNDYQQMDYSKLTPILTAALQEALTRIETLEAKVQSVIDAQPKL